MTTLFSFQQHLNEQYGKPGTPARERYEKEFKSFKRKTLKGKKPL